MKDQFVATIQTLTNLLVEKTEQLESIEESLNRAWDERDQARRESDKYYTQVEQLEADNRELSRRLSEVNFVPVRMDETIMRQHHLLMGLFAYNGGAVIFAALQRYMNVEADRTAKIKMIKRVREITNWGLKEAKDFVENYPFPPVEQASAASE